MWRVPHPAVEVLADVEGHALVDQLDTGPGSLVMRRSTLPEALTQLHRW
jgi:hypothetical protein